MCSKHFKSQAKQTYAKTKIGTRTPATAFTVPAPPLNKNLPQYYVVKSRKSLTTSKLKALSPK